MTDAPTLVWGAAQWWPVAGTIAAGLLALLLWGYWGTRSGAGVRSLAAGLKALGVLVLAACLLEPMFSGTRARPGANLFAVLVDNSQSMTLQDEGAGQTRGNQAKAIGAAESKSLSRLGQDFDLRQHAFDTQVRALAKFEDLSFAGVGSNLGGSLERLVRQYKGRPLAGILLLSDGSATDAEAVERLMANAGGVAGSARLPPIYPVLLGSERPARDINLGSIAVTQTNFEDSPVTLTAQLESSGYRGRTVVAELLDESGKSLERQTVKVDKEDQPLPVRFRLKPEKPGVSFYRVRAAAEGETIQPEQAKESPEATLANNTRLVAVDRGRGPYRVLYVAGRPNWEYKFLQRALQSDDQVQLVGLLRIAKREPKFDFRDRRSGDANPLFRGFDHDKKETVEQYDQPVFVRLGTTDENELRGGFPKTADELYGYHAVILDDVESEFFTQDQMQLLKEFVRQRGGGLLMLGGQETFKNGKYDRTPIGDLLPVYADEVPPVTENARYRLALTREGWLEPWVRLRPEEDAERKRLGDMPPFQTLNPIRGIKPGATVLARVEVGGSALPALVEQRFGQGRAAALLIGDLWRWGLRRPENAPDDLPKAWRQAIRWLVADVPQRVDVALNQDRSADDPAGSVKVDVRVRDVAYAPLDNAAVTVRVTGPDGKAVELRAEPSGRKAGLYESVYVPRQPGAYRAEILAKAPDGSDIGTAQAGWASDPAADEFRDLRGNRDLLERLAKATGGQTVNVAQLDDFVATLPTRRAAITEPYVRPVWHQPWVYLLAILCVTAEWGLRRWKGLP
jgi:uncharacterized membrane protein